MHIPAYAYAAIRAALPSVPTSRQVGGLDCCLCDEAFGRHLAALPLGPTPTSGLFGGRSCLKRLVTQVRRNCDASRTQDAERARAESSAWKPVRERHLARLDSVRQAAEAVAELTQGGAITALRVAGLLVALESAYDWVPEAPKPPASAECEDSELTDTAFRLDLAMISAREAVAERLAYHLINEEQGDEPEMCEELDCPEGCSGRHDFSHIDCGPDSIYEQLVMHGVTLEQPAPHPPASPGRTEAEEPQALLPGVGEGVPVVLARRGIDADDTDVLVSVAAVGLVADAWREGPLDLVRAADDGPNDGEIFAQSVDLSRRARAALRAAPNDGADALLAFLAVASDVDLPWAGGSRFALRKVSQSVAEFVQHVDDRVWFTTEVRRKQGWRATLLHRAASAVFKTPAHFGMPGWPDAVASAMKRLALLDRSSAPEALRDLGAVETALLEAPHRLGVDALDWLSHHALFD